jgi:hypothetical protein
MSNAGTVNRETLKKILDEDTAREAAFDKANDPAHERVNAPAKDHTQVPVAPAADVVPPVVVPSAMFGVEVKKPERGRGRPKSKPVSRLASFHLPVALIDKLDAEAARTTAGNKSLFIVNLLNAYFSNK